MYVHNPMKLLKLYVLEKNQLIQSENSMQTFALNRIFDFETSIKFC